MSTPKIVKVRGNKRIFMGLPVRDAIASIKVQPNEEDIKNGIPLDPCRCAFALALKRQYNAKEVFVYNNTSYVQMLDEEGNPIFERFQLPKPARAFRYQFDNHECISPAGLVFNPPRPGYTLDAKDRYYQQAKANGTLKPKPIRGSHITGEKRPAGNQAEQLSATRPGPGKVHFK